MKMFAKTIRSASAFLLVAALFLGVCSSPIALAAEAIGESKPLVYVSLGDSTTNGYGLTGYEFSDEERATLVAALEDKYGANWYNFMEDTIENPNGLLMETPGAYPALFRNYLAEATGKKVNLIQLATSAMRADDVLTLLTWGTDDYFDIDDYSGNKFNSKYVVHNYSEVANDLPFDWEFVLGEEEKSMGLLYQQSVEAADVISINLGSNNFSIYMWGCLGPMIMGMMGSGDGSADYVPVKDALLATIENEALAAFTDKVSADIEAILVEKLSGAVEGETLQTAVENLADYGAYTFLSYCITYTKILDRINELNKDADIIIIPPVNFMKGFTVDVNGKLVDMSEYITYILEAANTYVSTMAGMKDAEFENDIFWADHGGKVDMLMAEMVELEATNFEGAEVLHKRLISSLIGWVDTLSGGAFDLNSAGEVTREAVAAYKTGDINYFMTNHSANGLEAMVYYIAYVGAYVGMEKALISASQMPAVDVNMFLDIVGGTFTAKVTEVFGAVGDTVGGMAAQGGADLAAGDPATLFSISGEVANILENNDTSLGMLYVMAYFMVADGVVCHPSAKGYQTVYEKMVGAYKTITADDASNAILGEDAPAIKAVYRYLATSGYMSTTQAVSIADFVYVLYMDDMDLSDEEMTMIADFIFETLFYADIEDSDRIAIIGNVYAILDAYYDLSGKEAVEEGKEPSSDQKNIQAVENVVKYLYGDNPYGEQFISDDQAFFLVQFIYWTVSDGIQDNDIMDIVRMVYEVIFNGMSVETFADLGDVDDPSLSSEQKLDLLMTIYGEFKAANPEIVAANPELVVVEELYETLTDDTDGEALLSDEQLFAIVDTAVKALVVDEKSMEDAVKEITSEVNTQIESLPTEKKLEVLEKVSESVDKLGQVEGGSGIGGVIGGVVGGGSESDSMVSMKDFTKALGIANKVVANLRAEGLFSEEHSDKKFTAITNAVIGMILNNDQLDAATLAETAFSMLFEQPGHTLEKKIRIVVVIYETLHEEKDNLVIGGYDFFGDVDKFVAESEELVEDLKDIIFANEETVKELYADLETLNVELEVLVKDLNTKVAELNKLENEVLVNLVADRNALVAELVALEEKLVAVQNGTYGRSAVSEKDALIADTKAAIENTKAAIAELDNTIAFVKNQIKTDKSGIEAIKADIAEIKGAIAATETALAEVVAALDQLNADLVVLTEAVDVLYNVAIGQFVKPEDVVNAVKAIADVVPAIVENVKALYELGVEVAEKVEATVNVINENIESINAAVEALNASAQSWVDVNVDKAEAIADTLESVNVALNAFVNDNYPVVEEKLLNTVDELNKALQHYVEYDVIPLWEDYKIVALAAAGMAYLYVDEKGYIEDAKNAINGYIADAEAMLEDLKPELEKAKVELEKAKAELEAKLPVWKEDLKQLKEDLLAEADAKKEAAIEKAIAEIEAKIEAAEKVVAELEAFVAEVEAHVANVEAALEAVKAALAVVDGDLLALNDALVNLVDALKDLGCSVAGLGETLVGEAEKLVGYGIMIHEDIVAVVESLSVYGDLAVRLAEVVKNDIIENKLAVLKYVAEMIKPVCEYLVKAIANAVVEYLPELDAALYDYFYNNPEEVIDFVKTYGPYLLPIVEEYGDEALAVIGFVLYMYGEDMAVYVIENHEEVLAGFIAWADKYGDRTVAMLQVYAEALGLCDAVRDQIAELEAELEKLEAELEKVTGEAKEAIEAEIAKVKAEIEALNAKVEAVIDALNKVVVDANAKVEDVIEDLEAALKDLEAAVKDLENAVEDLVNETLKAIRDEIFASNRIVLEKILGIAEDILNKNITSLEELVEALDDAAVEAAKEIKAIIDELIYDATHGDYVIDNDSFYVALGDSSAVSKSYVDALAAALGVDYANLAQKGLTTSGTLALIAEQADVLAKADLVTVGYTANMFTAEVVNTINAIMMGEEVAEYDWAALVTEDGVEYVEKALAEVHAKFVEQELDVDFMGRNLADTLTACVEAYAYKYVEHVLTYPELVNAIHAVAPEALVVIVGMHNTVENIVIDVEGNEIALGDYIQYTVDAANVLSLVNAMLVENTIFVDAPDVETLKEAGGDDLTYDMLAFVWEVLITEGADFATSEAGHAYITEQILNALNVVDNRTGLLGDANSDGVVDSTDAMLVLQYDALIIGKEALNLVVCDVDGDGDVDSTDAMYILQYDGLLIEVFPVEE